MTKNYFSNWKIIRTDKYLSNRKVVSRTLACLFLLSVFGGEGTVLWAGKVLLYSHLYQYTKITNIGNQLKQLSKLTF